MAILELKNIHYQYKTKYQVINALNDVSIDFELGKSYSIVGPSGSGKSTLLSIIAGLDKPLSGEVYYDGRNLTDMDKDIYRQKHLSFIYQSYHLLPLMTVMENICYPMELNKVPISVAKESAKEYLNSVGLDESYLKRFPSTLSGGEQQRVAIARALANESSIILADEPTGNLDSSNGENIMNILTRLVKEKNYCIIIVTHDLEIAKKTDVMIGMQDGRIVS